MSLTRSIRFVAFLLTAPAAAQGMADMSGMAPGTDHSAMPGMDAKPSPENRDAMPGMGHDAMPGMNHGAMAGMDHAMTGVLGDWSMAREASGTAWQPDASAMDAVHWTAGGWSLMAHGSVTGVYDNQGGRRGDTKAFSQSMGMLMATRPLGERDRIGLRAMVSLDPLMGRRGYPLLLATGETADGRTGLVDRQHPHDLFMELAATYAHDIGGGHWLSLYAAYPGEPALGPPTFMHRASGMDLPEAPIGHHWFDSTHITFGVVTAGIASQHWKLETSAFKGREPDQHRYDFDSPKLDSWSVRAFWNPDANWSLQASTGHLKSPEQLHPEQDEQRTTASVSYGRTFGARGHWATTLAWSAKDLRPGPVLHALLAETALRIDGRNTVFARAERKQDDELFENEALSPLHEQRLAVAKFSLGYARTLPLAGPLKLDLGGFASAYAWPNRVDAAYGKPGVKSFMLFARIKLASD